MAHFAELDSNNVVLRVVVIANDVLLDDNNVEQESLGKAFCVSLFGSGTWVQTSYNNNMRQIYAQVGGEYDSSADKFKPRKRFDSWVWNASSWDWEAPVAMPEDGGPYTWNEDQQQWDS